ncbi:Sn1-specific diacylglycerol lipase alpha [Trachymyrmex septentrionalis]|uniref:Diacylglycerol lipase-alpha n=1 Tax=Trachymyrmex septentrionalis TaxID=34720 RepID=A0A151JSU4_9HYME|nr:Sn1-specific diacylglycerol lipase alpha [Trachymyrmex septentrionalis]
MCLLRKCHHLKGPSSCVRRLTVLGILLGILEWDRSDTCVLLLWQYVIGYEGLFVVCMMVEFYICFLATRGSILDTTARAPMQYVLYFRLFLVLVETGWLCTGITWLARYYQTCPVDQAKDVMLAEFNRFSDIELVPAGVDDGDHLVHVRCSWQVLGEDEEISAQHEGGGIESSKIALQTQRQQKSKLAATNSFADIARLLSDFFRDLDVVPSDVVAGLVLLRKFQKIERELIVKQRKNDTYEFLSGVPVTPRTKFLSLTEDGDLGHFQLAIHYMHFALAAYGWPMFLVDSSTQFCQLCTRLQCCCCFPCGTRHEDMATVIEDNCCRCNYAALSRMLILGEIEVVYATFHVDVGETPFFVALDYTKRKIVISIRGTLSMKDVLTDLNAEGEVLPLSPPREDWFGHKGMVQAAEYIRKKLQEEDIIACARAKNTSRGTHHFGLTLVGHSLGAGTAAILAILLKQDYPDLMCFSFGPPGGLLSMPAQQYTQEFITSVVVGKDVVPRIGLRQMESLRADLINAIKRSVDPKWKTIACSVMCCGCGSTPTSAANLEAGGCISEYQRDKDRARAQTIVPSDSSIALTLHRPLYPPGRIIHVVRHHPNKGEQKYETSWRQVLSKREPVYQALWAGPCDFDEVLISPVMIQDHMPDNMLRALNKVSRDASVVRQQVKRSQTPLSRTPSVKPGHYEPLEETADGPDIPNEVVVQRDRISRTTDQAVNSVDRAHICPGVDCTSIVVDVCQNRVDAVVTTLGPAKPQRLVSGHASSTEVSSEAAREHQTIEIQELELQEQEMRALLSPSSPTRYHLGNLAGTPPHRLCLETSFTSLQSPTDIPQAGRELSVDSRGIPWEYVSLASELLNTPRPEDGKPRPSRWDDSRTAPLATPETLSEASTSSPPSPVVPAPRPMRRTPKIPGNLSTAADDLKNNLHYAMLSAKNYFLRTGEHAGGSNNGSSSGNSEASYESARSLAAAGLPPPVPRRRDSVIVRREQRTCTAACCRDDLSENSSTHTSSHSSRVSRTSHHVQVEFNEEETGSSLDFYEAKDPSGQRDSSNDVFLSVRSSPECKGLMAPATDLGAEWKKGIDATGVGGDASLPLLRGLSPTPTPGQHNSPFFNAKRKKYVYPITLVGRGESSV